MKNLYFYMFNVTMILKISLPSWPAINTLHTMVDRERFSVFTADRRVQKSGPLCHKGLKFLLCFSDRWLWAGTERTFGKSICWQACLQCGCFLIKEDKKAFQKILLTWMFCALCDHHRRRPGSAGFVLGRQICSSPHAPGIINSVHFCHIFQGVL